MFRKILIFFIVMLMACIIALTITILDAQTVEKEKRQKILPRYLQNLLLSLWQMR